MGSRNDAEDTAPGDALVPNELRSKPPPEAGPRSSGPTDPGISATLNESVLFRLDSGVLRGRRGVEACCCQLVT